MINSREFAKTGLGLFGWGMFAGSLGGCSILSGKPKPNLTIGIVSDIHIRLVRKGGKDSFEGEARFRKALEWFRDQGVDGVTISGDLADHGLVEELVAVARTWCSVFPDDKAPDGRHVERLFVYGNHDWEGFRYGDTGKKLFGDDFRSHAINTDPAAAWRKAFGEEYSPVWRKEVNGYTFVGAHWIADKCRGSNEIGVPQAPEWFKANGNTIDPAKPFFYLQHPPPKNTCHGPLLWGQEDGRLTETLSQYRNAIAITGHSHASLSIERAIWQGSFTAIDASSLSYTGLLYGDLNGDPTPCWRENDTNRGDRAADNAKKVMRKMNTRDGHQGMVARVYDDCIVFERHDFESQGRLGDDWIMPLPAKEPMPFAFASRAASSVAPQFRADAKISARLATGKNRGGGNVKSEECRVLEVTVPTANLAGAGRVCDYAVEISGKNGGTDRRYFFDSAFHRSPDCDRANMPTVFSVDVGLLESKGDFLITVAPRNSFGIAGKALSCHLENPGA